jgi:hypothetical protein
MRLKRIIVALCFSLLQGTEQILYFFSIMLAISKSYEYYNFIKRIALVAQLDRASVF